MAEEIAVQESEEGLGAGISPPPRVYSARQRTVAGCEGWKAGRDASPADSQGETGSTAELHSRR